MHMHNSMNQDSMAAPPSFHQDPGAALCRTGVKSARHRSLNLRALGNGAGHQRSSNMARKSLRLRPPPRPNWLRKSRRLRPDPLPSRLSKSRRPPPSRPPPRSCRSLPLARRPPTPTRSLPHCPLRPPPPAKYQVASKFSSSSSRLQATSVSKFQASSSQARPAVSAPLSPEDGPSKQMAVAGSGYASGQLDGAKKNRTRVAIQTGSDSYKRICSLAFAPKGGLNLEDALTHAKGRNQEILEEFFNAAEVHGYSTCPEETPAPRTWPACYLVPSPKSSTCLCLYMQFRGSKSQERRSS